MLIKKTLLFTALCMLFGLALTAQGGMWMPLHLKKQNEAEMKSLGLKIRADDIYHPENKSLKDAICLFGGGCTGEIISPKGLLLTNHHCGFDAIQSLSSLENNYIDNGFWAKDMSEELPAAGVTATFVVRMEDVTRQILNGITENMTEASRQSQIDQNIARVKANVKIKPYEEVSIRPFYAGNQYYMYITMTYRDVRLVGAPPSSIGKFGADTDNWVWPRHTGDFAIFRVYAGKDNLPAEYSKENVPFVPRHFLPISLDGVEAGDFTMVYGFPGRTDEYLPAAALRQIAQVTNPARVSIRDRTLKILDAAMRANTDVKIAYIARQAHLANAWKKWLGEMQGLTTFGAIEKKLTYEAEFSRRVQQNPAWKRLYSHLLPRLNQAWQQIEPYNLARDVYLETMVRNCEMMGEVAGLKSWLDSYVKNGEIFFASKIASVQANMESFYNDFRPSVDEAVFAAMAEIFAIKMPAEWGGSYVRDEAQKHGGYDRFAAQMYANSVITDKGRLLTLLAKSPTEVYQTLINDPAVVFWQTLNDAYTKHVQPKIQEIQPQINALQRNYMAAQLEVFAEKKFFPDANSTLRLTYGKVKPYRPRDAVQYDYMTFLDGVIEKYKPGDYEFDVPEKLIQLWKSKDYGQYATRDGRLPVAFVGSNHTTGGNSGSPALDAHGHLIGLNFDRVWEGTMSDLHYDPAICRNIMVDARYILFIIDKFAGAGHLLQEMHLVKGKKRPKKRPACD